MVRRTTMENGVRVLTELVPGCSSVSIGIWIDVGSRDETLEEAGISHFLEHILFKGTARYTAREIAELVEGVGGYINGATDKEQTCFSARVMASHLPLAIDLLTEMLLHSTLDPVEIEREKNVVNDEIRTYDDSPSDLIQDLYLRTLWRGHPLAWPTLGTDQTLRRINSTTLRKFLDTYYHGNTIIITAAGAIDHDDVVRRLEASFGRLPLLPPPMEVPVPECSRDRLMVQKDCEQVYICLGGEGTSLIDDRRYPVQVLDAILGGGMSSRLFQEVRESRGLVYNVGSYLMSFQDCGSFGAYVVTGPQQLEEVLTCMQNVMADLRRDGVTRKELERAREYLKGSFILSLESTSSRMSRLLRTELTYGEYVPPDMVLKAFDNVTQDQVNAEAARLLDTEKFATVVMGPLADSDTAIVERVLPGRWQQEEEPAGPVRV